MRTRGKPVRLVVSRSSKYPRHCSFTPSYASHEGLRVGTAAGALDAVDGRFVPHRGSCLSHGAVGPGGAVARLVTVWNGMPLRNCSVWGTPRGLGAPSPLPA